MGRFEASKSEPLETMVGRKKEREWKRKKRDGPRTEECYMRGRIKLPQWIERRILFFFNN